MLTFIVVVATVPLLCVSVTESWKVAPLSEETSTLAGAVTTMAQAGWFHDSQYGFKQAGGDIKRLIDAGGIAGVGSHGQQQGIGYHWSCGTSAWAMA